MIAAAAQRLTAPGEGTLSTHDQVARALGVAILSGQHPPGSLLPHESELLSRFAISRTVLREALKTLAAKGFIVSRTRVGTRVQPEENWNYFDAQVLSWKLSLGYDDRFREDLSAVRSAIEPEAARLAALRNDPASIARLRSCIVALRRDGHDPLSYARADLELHLAVAAVSGNVLMRSIGTIIEAALAASFRLNSPIGERAVLEESIARHEAIVDAIERGDGDAAAAAMRFVIEWGSERIRTVLHGENRQKSKPRSDA